MHQTRDKKTVEKELEKRKSQKEEINMQKKYTNKRE